MKRMVREPIFRRFFGVGHDLLDLLDAGEDGGELDEAGAGDVGDDAGEGGFADAGRSPEDHRGGVVALDLHAEGLAGGEEMLLPDEFVESAGTHALGERERRRGFGMSGRGWDRRGSWPALLKPTLCPNSGRRGWGTRIGSELRAQSTGLSFFHLSLRERWGSRNCDSLAGCFV